MSHKEREQAYLLNLFSAPYSAELKEEINLPDIEKAEAAVSAALAKVPDGEAKFEIDRAVGMIAAAYEKLGFIVGYKTHKSGV